MAIKTTTEQLEEVQAAITAVMSGQSYKIGDVQFTRASLSSLQTREQYLLKKYRSEQDGSRVSRANFSNGI